MKKFLCIMLSIFIFLSCHVYSASAYYNNDFDDNMFYDDDGNCIFIDIIYCNPTKIGYVVGTSFYLQGVSDTYVEINGNRFESKINYNYD